MNPSRLSKKEQAPSTDQALNGLLDKFSCDSRPIKVNFRELVDWVRYGERATHLIHPYPGKLLAHIPHFFLNNQILSQSSDLVLDPFCGSGTVALETVLAKRRAVAFDCNPLGRFIAKVKVTPLDPLKIADALKRVSKRYPLVTPDIPAVVNREYWYSQKNTNGLGKLRAAISEISNTNLRDFMRASLSVCARKLSYADPRISVPVRINCTKSRGDKVKTEAIKNHSAWIKKVNPLDLFSEIVEQNARRMSAFVQVVGKSPAAAVFLSDARVLTTVQNGKPKRLAKNSVQLIITSPPYAGAQKYVRSASLSLGWLGLAAPQHLRPLEIQTIGREHYGKSEYATLVKTGIPNADVLLEKIYGRYPLRAHIAANYLLEMAQACARMVEVLKPGGYIVLVIGNNQVCGEEFQTKEYLKEILMRHRLLLTLELVDDIHSRGLMTKRNKTASLIASEWVLIFQKPKYV